MQQQETINKEIIFMQMEDIVERAIAENDAVLNSFGTNVGEESTKELMEVKNNETSSREELQVIY